MNLLFRNFWNTLRRYKVASVLNILGLSIAFAAFAVIMMQVRYDLTYDKFHTNYDRIYRVETKVMKEGGSEIEMFSSYIEGVSLPMTRLLDSFHPDILATAHFSGNQTGYERIKTELSTEDFPFRENVVGINPGTLRVFDFNLVSGDTVAFALPNTVLISQSHAQKMFPDEDPIGKTIYSSSKDVQFRKVIGVYRDFPVNSFLKNDLYVRNEYNKYDEDLGSFNGMTFIRISSSDKKEDVEQSIRQHLLDLFGANYPYLYRLTSFRDTHYVTDVSSNRMERINSSRTYLFLGIAALIILIAGINFINFSTALVPVRLKKVNTRRVLGQTSRGIRISMMWEAMGVCLISVLISYWIIYTLSHTSFVSLLPADMRLSVNIPILFYMLFIALVTGILAGVYPAFLIASFPPALVLKGAFGASPKGRKLRLALTGFQYFISFALIIVALFMQLQHRYMLNHPLGYSRENVLTFQLNTNLSRKTEVVGEVLLQHPSIRNAGFSQQIIFGNVANSHAGREYQQREVSYHQKSVSPGLIGTLGIELLEGRDFVESDSEKKDGVFLVNETARIKYGLEVGLTINNIWGGNEDYPPSREEYEIVGVFRDFNYLPLQNDIDAMVLHLPNKNNQTFRNVYLRVDGAAIPAVIQHIRQSLAEIDPNYKNYSIQFIDETIGQYYEKERKLGTLISVFSLLAICISLMGVFGLVLFEIQYRRKEISLRKIHGATVSEILALLNMQFAKIVLMCFILAVAPAWYAVSRWREQFAYRSPLYLWVFLAALLAVLLVTLLTVTLQSYRAATENPINSIKTE